MNLLKNEVPEHYYKKCFKVFKVAFKFMETKPTIHPDVFTVQNVYFNHRVNLN